MYLLMKWAVICAGSCLVLMMAVSLSFEVVALLPVVLLSSFSLCFLVYNYLYVFFLFTYNLSLKDIPVTPKEEKKKGAKGYLSTFKGSSLKFKRSPLKKKDKERQDKKKKGFVALRSSESSENESSEDLVEEDNEEGEDKKHVPAPSKKPIFGLPLDDVATEEDPMPPILHKCLQYLLEMSLDVPG